MTRHFSFLMPKIMAKLNGVTRNGGAKCRCGRLNAREVAENWRLLMRRIVNLARSQVNHNERPSARLSDTAHQTRLSVTADPCLIGWMPF